MAADVPALAGDVTGLTPLTGGGLASAAVGQARLVGAMSVPPSWVSSTAPSRTVSSAGLSLGAVPAAAGATGGSGSMPMMPMPMGGAGAGGPGGMLGRGGSQVMQQRPSVIPGPVLGDRSSGRLRAQIGQQAK